MLLGSQYYRPPFPNRAYWQEDMAKMRDAGLNTIQHWVVWAWVEPRPGKFRFEDYDELVSLAERYDLQVVLSTIAAIHPYWIHRVVPGSEMIDHMGRTVISSNRGEVNHGLTPGGCFDHPGVWDHMSRFLREVVTRYRTSKALAGWDAWNELRWNVQSDGLVCFCPHTLRAFREWLDRRHGGLDGLNRAWQRRYDQWDEVLPGKLPNRPYTEMMAFEHFITWRANRHGRARYEVMKSLDPDHPITLHAGHPCTLTTGDMENHAVNRGNDWNFADDCDGVGMSSFPVWGGMEEEQFILRVESVASAARGKRVWLSEIQGGQAACGFIVEKPVPAANQQRWIYNGLARGAEAMLFWCWRDEVFGRESGGFGLAGRDGLADERLAAMAVTGRWLRDHAQLLADYRPTAPRVGVWFSPQTYYLHWARDGQADVCARALCGYSKALIRSSVPMRVVEEEHLDVLDELNVLFLPRTLVMDDNAADAVTRWTEAGGILVCESECGAFTSNGFYRYPEDRFLARWGVQEVGRRVPDGETLRFRLDENEYDLPFEQWFTPLRCNGGEESMLADQPAGQGRVIVLGTYLGQARYTPDFQAFVRHVAGPGIVEILSPNPNASESSLCARTGRSGDTNLIFVFCTTPGSDVHLRIRPEIAADGDIRNLLTGRTHTTTLTSEGAECTVRTNPWGVAVLATKG